MQKKNIFSPFQRFVKIESFSGILLLIFTILVLLLANSPLSESYQSLWQYKIGFKSAHFELYKPLILWINDGLMAIFISGLAFKDNADLIDSSKISILMGSYTSAIIGYFILRFSKAKLDN